MGKDVVSFLSWAAEPEMEERKLVSHHHQYVLNITKFVPFLLPSDIYVLYYYHRWDLSGYLFYLWHFFKRVIIGGWSGPSSSPASWCSMSSTKSLWCLFPFIHLEEHNNYVLSWTSFICCIKPAANFFITHYCFAPFFYNGGRIRKSNLQYIFLQFVS